MLRWKENHITHNQRKCIQVAINGDFDGGKVLYMEPDWTFHEFLNAASQRLDLISSANRVFNVDGVEIDDCMMIEDNDLLFLSMDSDFIAPNLLHGDHIHRNTLHDSSPKQSNHKRNNNEEIQTSIIGGYKVLNFLGKGGFGEVRLGEHQLTGERVALKFLRMSDILSIGAAERTVIEIQCLSALKHQNIIKLQQHFESAQHVVLVFELMEGGDLMRFLSKRGTLASEIALPEDEARPLFHQILSGISFAHNQHICHRDLKLENILLKGYNLSHVKIADFGLSDFYRPGSTMKSNCGTISFLAPEVFRGTSNAGPPLDIWSLGVILFSILCGRLPFEGIELSNKKRPRDTIIKSRILKCQYKIDENLGPEVKDMVRRMLKPDPDERASIPEIFNHVWMRPTNNGQYVDTNFQINSSNSNNTASTTSNASSGVGNMSTYSKMEGFGKLNSKIRISPRPREKSIDIDGDDDDKDKDKDKDIPLEREREREREREYEAKVCSNGSGGQGKLKISSDDAKDIFDEMHLAEVLFSPPPGFGSSGGGLPSSMASPSSIAVGNNESQWSPVPNSYSNSNSNSYALPLSNSNGNGNGNGNFNLSRSGSNTLLSTGMEVIYTSPNPGPSPPEHTPPLFRDISLTNSSNTILMSNINNANNTNINSIPNNSNIHTTGLTAIGSPSSGVGELFIPGALERGVGINLSKSKLFLGVDTISRTPSSVSSCASSSSSPAALKLIPLRRSVGSISKVNSDANSGSDDDDNTYRSIHPMTRSQGNGNGNNNNSNTMMYNKSQGGAPAMSPLIRRKHSHYSDDEEDYSSHSVVSSSSSTSSSINNSKRMSTSDKIRPSTSLGSGSRSTGKPTMLKSMLVQQQQQQGTSSHFAFDESEIEDETPPTGTNSPHFQKPIGHMRMSMRSVSAFNSSASSNSNSSTNNNNSNSRSSSANPLFGMQMNINSNAPIPIASASAATGNSFSNLRKEGIIYPRTAAAASNFNVNSSSSSNPTGGGGGTIRKSSDESISSRFSTYARGK